MRVYNFEEIDSTNKFLKEKEDLEDRDLVITKTQTAGRGRRGNKWITTEGSAIFSFALRHDFDIEDKEYMKLPLLVGYSLLKTLKKVEDLDYKFKWTNDLYLEEKKISGILVEKIGNFYIIGIGLNVNNENLNLEISKGLSLKEKTGKNYDINCIINLVIEDFYKNFKDFKDGNWSNILKEINKFNYLFGRRIDIVGIEKEEKGIAGDILEDGTLEVFVGSDIRKYNIGEIHISKS